MQILGLLGQGVGEGEFFENSEICKIELEDQNGGTAEGKPLIDIDMVLAPYCPQMARIPYRKVYFSISRPNLAFVFFWGGFILCCSIYCYGRMFAFLLCLI